MGIYCPPCIGAKMRALCLVLALSLSSSVCVSWSMPDPQRDTFHSRARHLLASQEPQLELTIGSKILNTTANATTFVSPWGTVVSCQMLAATTGWPYVFACNVSGLTQALDAVLQGLSASVTRNVTDFISPPKVIPVKVQSSPPPPPASSTTTTTIILTTTTAAQAGSTTQDAGIVVGGVLLVLAVMLGAYMWITGRCSRKRRALLLPGMRPRRFSPYYSSSFLDQ